MTALVRKAPKLRAVPTSHVSLQLMDRRALGPTDDVQRDSLMRVAAEAPNFKVDVTSIERIA
jgi:hypothetical protein